VSEGWPQVSLGAVLTHRKEFIEIDDTATYKRCRVQLHAQGIVLRDLVTGAEVKTKRQQVCRTGDFLVAEIDAKVGGFGLVPAELERAIVSSHYFLFEVNDALLDRRFLDFYCRTPAFREQVSAQGSTNYAAIRPSHVLGYVMPLPPLHEQRRIVARIEELAGKVEEARGLRREAVEETKRVVTAARTTFFDKASDEGWQVADLNDVAPINMGQSPPGETYNEQGLGIPLLNGPTEFGQDHPKAVQWTTAPTKLCQPNDILLCVRGATTGRMNRADQPYCIGRGLAALSPIPGLCESRYLFHFVATQTQTMLALTAGSTFPNLPGDKLKRLKIPLPPIGEQQRIVEELDNLQCKFDALKRLQAETSQELDALLPSVLDKAFRGEL